MMKRVWVAQGLMPQPRCRRISVMYCRSITAKLSPKRLSISPFHCSTTDGGATTTTRCTFWRSNSSRMISPASIVLPRPTSSAMNRLTRGIRSALRSGSSW